MNDNDNDNIIPEDRFTPEPEADPGTPQTGPGNGEEQDVPLIINGQYIKDFSFEAPNTPDVFPMMQSEAPQIQVDIDAQAGGKGENLYEVILKVRAEAKVKDQLAYLIELEYAGLFTVNVQAEHLGPVLLIECPLILFPFLRRIVADTTSDGGFAPLMLAPIDFAQLYQQRMLQAQAEAEAEANSGGVEAVAAEES